MTLLDDLRALDLSSILAAKADISVTVNADELIALVGDGAATAVLGDVGSAIRTAVDAFEDPAALVEPITSALTMLLNEIDADIPLGDYVEAVTSAARVVADLVAVLSGDPSEITVGDLDLGRALEQAGGPFRDHAAVISGNLARFRALVQSVERGLPADAAALTGAALEIVLPFPTGSIDAVRTWALQLSGRLDGIAIDPRLTEGLAAALAQVKAAADAGDAAAVQTALSALADVRAHTIQQLAAALRGVAGAVSGLRVHDGAAPIHELRSVLAGADETVFELLGGWRDMIASVRATVGSIDATAAVQFFDAILDKAEVAARDVLLAGVDASVEVVKQWLRDLLREIPIRPLRTQVSEALTGAAQAVAEADLDTPVQAVRRLLTEVSTVLTDADPAALVQAAVSQLESVIREALDELQHALARITGAINDVAEQAESVLQRAVGGVREFREAVDDVTAAIESAGIVDAANDIAATIRDLREQVSELLAKAPVPEALRDAVGQLVSTLESIDLDAAIGAPLRQLAAQVQIPSDVATTVRDGLDAVAQAVASLVPDAVIADLESLMRDTLAEIEKLDVSKLTSGMTELLDSAASVFEQVQVAELMAPVGDIFDRIVATVDRVHPRVVLRPAIDLYAQILGAVALPDPQSVTARAGALTSQAGESLARAAAEPARRAVSSSATTPAAGSAPMGGAGPAREDQPADLRPGDIVRLVGFLPAKLREALVGLGTDAAGDVLRAIDNLLTATAGSLRDVRDRIVGLDGVRGALDAALAPITAVQVDAMLSLQGSAAMGAGGLDIDVSLSLVASANPAELELELAGERALVAERCRIAASSLTGEVADDLDEAADLLDAVLPSALLGDVDAFLAALDPEPIAAEFDTLLAAVVDATPAFLTAAGTELRAIERRVRALIETFNPGTLMQRFLGVLDVVREELSLLDPGRLADELGEVHAEMKAALLAYDPLVLATELDGLIAQVAAAIRGLDPANVMPDLGGIATQVARVADIVPVNALAGVGTGLSAVGEELRALDVQDLLDAVNALGPDIAEKITILIETVRDEIVALLETIRYTSTSASASVSVSVG